MNKYRAVRTTVDGITFDSKAEARRYGELCALAKARRIYGIERQTAFPLIVSGVKIGTYIADFCYFDSRHHRHVEDVKSPVTAKKPDFVMKRKLMRAIHGIDVEVVC